LFQKTPFGKFGSNRPKSTIIDPMEMELSTRGSLRRRRVILNTFPKHPSLSISSQ